MRRALAGLQLLLILGAPARGADNIFDLARRPGERVVISQGEQSPSEQVLSEPPMLRRVHGVFCTLKDSQAAELMAIVDPKPGHGQAGIEARRLCVVHIDGPAGSRAIAIEQQSDGVCFATMIGAQGPQGGGTGAARTLLRRDRVDRLLGGAGFLGSFDAVNEGQAPGQVFEVSRPYQGGMVTLDAGAIRERIGASGYIRYDPAARSLETEKLFARLPAGYDARKPAGLIVWMDASASGRPPQPLLKALDGLGMICIGAANAGNERPVSERLQLAIDAVSTARRRWHVDPARVYVAGISGGAKMASILVPCFPDVFDGALSIVGLSSYENVPTGEGAKIWPAEYSRPRGARWESFLTHPIVAITGSKDFNHEPVVRAARLLVRDKVRVRVVDIDGLGHEFPTPEVLLEQIGWMDGDARELAEKSQREADAALALAHEAGRAFELLEVVRRWPWTEGAWKAVGELGK